MPDLRIIPTPEAWYDPPEDDEPESDDESYDCEPPDEPEWDDEELSDWQDCR